MLIKSEKGITGIDIMISLIVITLFITLIGTFVVNANFNSQALKRKSLATSYAVQEIEKTKVQGIEAYEGRGINEQYIVEEDIKINNEFSGYHKQIIVEDYVLIKQDNTKKSDILKKVTVNVSYKLGKEEKQVSISTFIVKE